MLADLCGVDCRVNPHFMPGTLCSLHAGVDWQSIYATEDGAHAFWRNQQAGLEKAIADGHFTLPDRHLPGMWHPSGIDRTA